MSIWVGPPATSAPKARPSSKSSGGSSSSGRSRSSSRRSSSSRSGGGGGSSDPYARARADAKAAEAKAAQRYAAQADLLLKQAEALKVALGSTGLRKELYRQLGAANLEFREEEKMILAQYARGKSSLEQSASTSEDSRARSSQEARQNASRERNEALQQGIENGISATDQLKAQAASLRNWAFNMGQVESNYTDEMNSIQSEHSQMVNSVITARQSAWREREQQRSQLYRGYYDNRGQVYTEIGNKRGEASAAYDMANEQKSSSTYRKKSASAEKNALNSLKAAAKQTGYGYTEKSTPSVITKWKGTADIEANNDPRRWGQPTLETKDAEGASSRLRKWEQ